MHSRSETEIDATFHFAIAFMGFNIDSSYRLRYALSEMEIRWDLVESPDVTINRGAWTLEETDDGETVAKYEAEIETSLPIPPDVQAAFTEAELPKLMATFRDRAEDL